MKFGDLVQVSLDELRMQMLGAQVLFGFQLQGVFQERFSGMSLAGRVADLSALSLIVLTIGLLLAVPSQHRLVDNGNDTMRIFGVARRFAQPALFSFALALACDIFVVAEGYGGREVAVGAAIGTFVVALLLWYGLGAGLRGTLTAKERSIAMPKETPTDLHTKINQMLTEARVILPGAQALLGFQFVVTMTKAFAAMPPADHAVHFLALAAVALSVMLLLAPAAVHRLTFGGRDVPRFHDIGSLLVTLALIPLAVGIAADVYVAAARVFDDRALAGWGSGVAFLTLVALWYIVPLSLRRSRASEVNR